MLTAAPATVTKPLVGNYKYTNLSATLKTTGGIPIPGKTIVFKVLTKQICTAATNSSGVATCSGTGPRQNSSTYDARFNGAPGYQPSSATGGLS